MQIHPASVVVDSTRLLFVVGQVPAGANAAGQVLGVICCQCLVSVDCAARQGGAHQGVEHKQAKVFGCHAYQYGNAIICHDGCGVSLP